MSFDERGGFDDPGPGLLESLWRFRRLVIATVVTAAVAGYGLSLLLPARYEANAQLILADPSSTSAFQDSTAGRDLSRYVRNEATYITSSEVLGRAADDLGGVDLETLRNSVTAVAANDVDLITISARRPTSDGAAEVANAVAVSYQELKKESIRLAPNRWSINSANRDQLKAQVDNYESALRTIPTTRRSARSATPLWPSLWGSRTASPRSTSTPLCSVRG